MGDKADIYFFLTDETAPGTDLTRLEDRALGGQADRRHRREALDRHCRADDPRASGRSESGRPYSFWRSPPLSPSSCGPAGTGAPPQEVPIPLPTPAPAVRLAGKGSAAPKTLTDRLALYLIDRRLQVEQGTRGVDLICELPPGRSSFRIHADLSDAMRIWGGEAVAGEETVLPGTGRVVDLTVTQSGESRVIRMIRREEAETAPRIAIVIDDFGHQSQSLIDGFFRLPFAFTPAVLPGYARSVATVRRARDAGRPPILHLPMEPRDAAPPRSRRGGDPRRDAGRQDPQAGARTISARLPG